MSKTNKQFDAELENHITMLEAYERHQNRDIDEEVIAMLEKMTEEEYYQLIGLI